MSMEITNILKIDEVGESFRVRQILGREWFDSQLAFKDLKQDFRMNILKPEEQSEIWFPEVVFENIASEEDWMEMLLSREYNVIMNPAGKYEPADTTKVANAFMFAGAENK